MVAMAKLSGRSSKARFAAYVREADRGDRPCRSSRTASRLLHGPVDAGREEERRADGGRDRAGAGGGSAPVPAALRGERALVGCGGAGQGARDRPAGDDAHGADCRLDHRRHGLSQEGAALRGVGRQYCGQLGKQDNCQVAVSLSLANHAASLPVSYRLYLPRDWAEDPARRAKAGVPEEIAFRTKPEIALDLLRAAAQAGLPRGVAVMDAAYGKDTDFRTGVSALGLSYVAAVLSSTTVWPPGTGPLPPKPWSGRGRRATRLRRDAQHQPVPVKAVALGLPETAWTEIAWRQGTNGELASRFARSRVRAAHADTPLSARREEEWLLIEWPEGEPEPTQYWLSTLPEEIGFEQMVDLAQLRWRIERDYQDLKQEVGLGHTRAAAGA